MGDLVQISRKPNIKVSVDVDRNTRIYATRQVKWFDIHYVNCMCTCVKLRMTGVLAPLPQ